MIFIKLLSGISIPLQDKWMKFSMHRIVVIMIVIMVMVTACKSKSVQDSTPAKTDMGSGVNQTPLSTVPTIAVDENLESTVESLNSSPTVSPTSTPDPSALTDPSKASPPDPPIYGMHIHNLDSFDNISLGQLAGTYWTRFDDFHWSAIEPTNSDPADYQWSTVNESGLINAAEGGFEIIGIILFTPEWAQKYQGVYCGPIADEAFDDFAEFMNDLVLRYSQPPYNVSYWEIGNEPDISRSLVPPDIGFGCWGEDDDQYYGGGYYGEMLKAVYPAIKAADPDAQVLVGGLNLDCDPDNPPVYPPNSRQLKDCTPSLFLEGILSSGGGDYFDGVSFHAYDYYYGDSLFSNGNWHSNSRTTGPVLINKTKYLDDLLSEYGYEDKYLINTEVALLCGSDGKEPFCQSEEFSTTKANYVAKSYAAALAEGLSGNVWYSLSGWRSSGLVNNALQPNEAYVAYKYSQSKLGSATFVREITDYPGVMGYEYVGESGKIWILWSLDDVGQEILLPSPSLNISNVYGEAIPSEQLIMVTQSPIYIEWTPDS